MCIRDSSDIAQGNITIEQSAGNSLADTWAGYGAELEQYPEEDRDWNNNIDGTAWLIQSRIVAVCTLFLEKAIKDPHTPKSRPNKDTHKLETLGHIPSSDEQGWRKCYLCGQRWSNHARLRMEKLGQCPGPNVWGRVPDAPSLTWRAPTRSKRGMEMTVHPLARRPFIKTCMP